MYTFNDARRSLDLLRLETLRAVEELRRLEEDLDVDRILGDQPTFPFLFQVGINVPQQATIRDRD